MSKTAKIIVTVLVAAIVLFIGMILQGVGFKALGSMIAIAAFFGLRSMWKAKPNQSLHLNKDDDPKD